MAIGDWDDNRNAANYQQIIEHEEFAGLANDQNRLLLGYDRITSAIVGDGSDTLSFNLVAWTEASWYTGLYIRAGLAWNRIGAWAYVTARSGTNYLKLEIRDANDVAVESIPNAAGVVVPASGIWVQIDKGYNPSFGESNGICYTIAVMGQCPGGGNFSIQHLQVYLTSILEP